MANAKKCDICGAYFGICEMKTSKVADYSFMNTITISQRDNKGNRIDAFNSMDCCPKCMENILDILNIKKKVEKHRLTCRELLAKHHPFAIGLDYQFVGGCESCPSSYGYLYSHEELCTGNEVPNDELCTKCWNQIATKYYDEKEKNNEQN